MEMTTETKPKRGLKVTDVVLGVIFIVVVIVLAVILMRQLSLKNEVNSARATTDRVATDIQQTKATDVRNLAVDTFKNNPRNTEANLAAAFKSVQPSLKGTRSVVSQTVTNTKDSKNVGVVYKYDGNKQPFYLRVVVTNPKNKAKNAPEWQISGLSSGTDQVKLEQNK